MKKTYALLLFILSLGLLTMCGGSGGDGQPITSPSETSSGGDTAGTGVLRVLLTDKPTENVDEVWVSIASVRVHQSGGAEDATGGWVEMPVTAPMPVDLLTLQNGVLMTLCSATLPAGNYQQVRLVLTPNPAAGDPSNYVKIGAETFPLDVPSDTIKILHSLSVGASQTTDLTLDFVAADSVRQRGNGTWYMQPVIKPASSTAG